MAFKALNLFKTELLTALSASDTSIDIPADKAQEICELINQGDCIPCGSSPVAGTGTTDYTQLVLFHNGFHEIVKVTGCVGGVPTIERGQEGTIPRALPVGTCVQFIWTAAAIQCAVLCLNNGEAISDHADCQPIANV